MIPPSAEAEAAAGDAKARAALADVKLWEGAGAAGWRVWPRSKTSNTGHYYYESPAGQRFTKRGDACNAHTAGEEEEDDEDEGGQGGGAKALSAEAAAAAAGDAKARAALADVKLWEGAGAAGWRVWPRSKTSNTGHYVYESPAGRRFTKRGDACDAGKEDGGESKEEEEEGEEGKRGEGAGGAKALSAEAAAAAAGDAKARAALADVKLWEGAGVAGWRVWPVSKTKNTGHYVYESPAGRRFTKRGEACDAAKEEG